MSKSIALILIAALLLGVGFLYLWKPDLFTKAIPWLIGFAGTVWAGMKKLFSTLTGGESIEKLEQENHKLKQDLDQINKDVVATNQKLEAIQTQYETDMHTLQQNLEQEKTNTKALLERTRQTLSDPDSAFENSLSPAMQQQRAAWMDEDLHL